MGRAAKNPVTGVTQQQERFAAEYIKTGRPSVAYRRAYDAAGMKPETIANNAHMLLNNSEIAARVEHYRRAAVDRLDASVERIALELQRLAFFDLGQMVDDEGMPIPLHELDEDTRRALNGMDIEILKVEGVEIGHVKKYKHVPKVEALRVLAQWRKMLVDRSEVGKPGEFDGLSTEEVERRAKEVLEQGVKLGHLKVLTGGKDRKRKVG